MHALHTMFVPSSCGIFVYRLETSIDTKIVSLPIFVFSMKLVKSGLLFLCNMLQQCIHELGYSLGG